MMLCPIDRAHQVSERDMMQDPGRLQRSTHFSCPLKSGATVVLAVILSSSELLCMMMKNVLPSYLFNNDTLTMIRNDKEVTIYCGCCFHRAMGRW